MVRRFAWLPLTLAVLAGCGNTVQTTSGAAYRAAHPEFDPGKGTAIDQDVDKAAAIEPLLRFPARLGLARIQNGDVAAVPPREADAWIAFAKDHPDLGSFVPISPLLSQFTTRSYNGDRRPVVETVRLAAARQHVDAVLIYTVAGSSDDTGTALSLADLTIMSAYLVPSRTVKGEATASGLLVDVRNGYPYGTVTTSADADGFVRSVGSGARGLGKGGGRRSGRRGEAGRRDGDDAGQVASRPAGEGTRRVCAPRSRSLPTRSAAPQPRGGSHRE